MQDECLINYHVAIVNKRAASPPPYYSDIRHGGLSNGSHFPLVYLYNKNNAEAKCITSLQAFNVFYSPF